MYSVLNTLKPYYVVDYDGIDYGVCRDFSHITQYRSLRQVVHNPNKSTRFIALETVNPFLSAIEVEFYDVPDSEENRLDIIAYNKLGSATYSWILAYLNHIEDGYTVHSGQQIIVPKAFNKLFDKGEILEPVSIDTLNLSSE